MYSNRFSSFLVGFLVAAQLLSCSKTSSKSSQSKGGSTSSGSELEVSGSIASDDPVDFVQASDSVQIGGVNLTTAISYELKAYSLESSGSRKLIFSGSFSEPKFSFKSKVDPQYILLEVLKLPEGKMFGAVLPPPLKSVKASVVVDATTTIASKMAQIMVERAGSDHRLPIERKAEA